MRKILYIHGAFSSGLSFKRIQERLPKHEAMFAEYTVNQQLEEIVEQVGTIVKQHDELDIIAHSLGGIVGVAVAQQNENIRSIITLSTPFGGSKVADLLRWLSSHELYRSLHGQNVILRRLQKTPLHCKHRCIVTTVGNNPMMFEPNDGVVSLKSQTAVPHAEQIQVPLNHFEVLLSDTTLKLIKDFTFK
jgi:pimeloyl-ACP methyl ester carboxylesterase